MRCGKCNQETFECNCLCSKCTIEFCSQIEAETRQKCWEDLDTFIFGSGNPLELLQAYLRTLKKKWGIVK